MLNGDDRRRGLASTVVRGRFDDQAFDQGVPLSGWLLAEQEKGVFDLKVGDSIKDNDPRLSYQRVLRVVEVLTNGVAAVDSGGRRWVILRRRIYTDGRPRQSGFDLVKDAP